MSNQSPCTDPLYPCTALTLAEKSAALEQLTWLRKHMLAVNFPRIRGGGRGNPRPAQGDDGG